MTPDEPKLKLLVVEDEPFLRKAVVASLRFLGFQVAAAENGPDALREARNSPFDLLIVDVMLPDIDGFEIVRRLRANRNQVPVIFLTAKDSQEDKLTGLTIGGDDYITKPFELEELAARVRAVLRRGRAAAPEPVLSFADLTLDQDTYEVRRGGRLIDLSPTEFRLLRHFMLNPGRVLTRSELLSHVWDYDFGGSSTVVSTYVTYLRRKLASDGPELIHTQRAVGYSLRLPRPDDEPGQGEIRPGQASADQPDGSARRPASPEEGQASSDES
jgi:two-component system, OmpR family, response regulator